MHRFIVVLAAVVAVPSMWSRGEGGGIDYALATVNSATRQTRAEAAQSDTALVAAARGWTVTEAKTHLHAAEIIGEIALAVSRERPGSFVGSAVAKDPTGNPILYLKGPVDDFVRALVLNADIPITVADNQPFSRDELDDRIVRVRDTLKAVGYDLVSVGANITRGGEITAAAAKTPGTPSESDALSRLPEDLLGGVDLRIVAPPTENPELTSFGGMRTWQTTDPDNFCTSGWTVQRISDGLFGTSTAGHCYTQNIENHPGHGDHTLSWKKEHIGPWGDTEWHSTSVGDQDDFYASEVLIRDVAFVEPRASISVGEPVCFFGRASSERDCSLEVLDTSISCDNPSGLSNRVVLMNGQGVAKHGDSGGGFSFANTAFGLMLGGCLPGYPYDPVTGNGWVGFSVADLLDEALGVAVYTG